jgi:PhzF family phenazine biosynthesis protein
MKLPLYIIDAFADRPMQGNPAGVCPLESWLPTNIMQRIASEINLSETVFFVPRETASDGTQVSFDVRWFTPTREVDMIGHATLAAGHLVLEKIFRSADIATFNSATSIMRVRRVAERLEIEMPALIPQGLSRIEGLADALGAKPKEVWAAKHYLAVFESPEEVRNLRPDFAAVAGLPLPAVIVTARDTKYDFVSRFFAPANGVPEDPVSGVAHCCLAPYWSKRLGKEALIGRQLSPRGGTVYCKMLADRVALSGSASIFLQGEIDVAD